MNKHTFKVGDRVFGQTFTGDKKVPGVFVKMGGYVLDGCIIRRDDGVSGIEPGLCWYGKHLTTHDTDFQVGDWVRYEGVHPRVVSPLLEGKVGKIEYLDGDSCAGIPQFHMQSGGVVYKENLVKIQPPQEESDNTIVHVFTSYTNKEEKMVIQEIESNNRRVHNVRECVVDWVRGWRRDDDNRVIFYPSTHWEPVEEWVKIEVYRSQWDMIDSSVGVFIAKTADHKETGVRWRTPR